MKSIIIIAFNNELDKVLKILRKENVIIKYIVSCPTSDLGDILRDNCVQCPVAMYHELPEILRNTYFDYVIISDVKKYVGVPRRIVRDCELSGCRANQIIDVSDFYTPEVFPLYNLVQNYLTDENVLPEFFITGVSHAYAGTNISCYAKLGLNLAFTSQDLFLDYELAKMVLQKKGNLKYALIAIAPFSLHYDLSKSVNTHRMLLYYPMIKKMHNSAIGTGDLQCLFNEAFFRAFVDFDTKLSFPQRMYSVVTDCCISMDDYINIRNSFKDWDIKEYPETVQENREIVRNYLQLVISKGIIPILVMFPLTSYYNRYFSKKKFDEVRDFCKTVSGEYNVQFLDLSGDERFYDGDFYDAEHLNSKGAAKVSKILSDVMFGSESRGI